VHVQRAGREQGAAIVSWRPAPMRIASRRMRIARGTRIAALLVAVLTVLSLVAARHAPAPAEGAQQRVTVYSSMPLQGAGRPQALAVVQGARLALEEAGRRAGPHPVRYISLDNSTARVGAWTPYNTAVNARKAAQDDSAVAYIGEFNSGASAISIPLLNEVPIAQISPTNAAVGLTRGGPGADPGEPFKYYPTGRRHYFRITPNDSVQAGALAVAMRGRGCRRIAVLNDGEVYGAGLGALVRRRARRLGLRIVHSSRIRVRALRHRGLARRVRRSGARCVAYTGITANGAVRLFRDLARALPRARLFGGDGIAESGFADPREGGVPSRVGRRVLVTVATRAPEALPEAGRAMLQRYAARYGEPSPDPLAVQGYESMRLVLDAVAAVGPRRRAVIRWLDDVRNRRSALGRYSFDRYGDTTLRDYGLYRIRRGALQWAGAVRAA
jgi:branched-chain amino acid transport system substrate-binding protein